MLAKRAGLAQSTIVELEKNPKLSSSYIVKIALALGVYPRWLDSGQGKKYMTRIEAEFHELSEPEQEAVLDYIKYLRAKR